MLHPGSRRVRRAHSAPRSRVGSTPALPQSPTPIYTGTGNILYIDATPPSSVVSMREEDFDNSVCPTPSLINGHPITHRTRHFSDLPDRRGYGPNYVGRPHVAPPPSQVERRNSGYTKHRSSRQSSQQDGRPFSSDRHHLVRAKPGAMSSWYTQPQTVSHWYELDDSGSQTSVVSDHAHHHQHHAHLHVPPMLTIQPPSTHNLAAPGLESSKELLNDYPPSPYEFDDEESIGPFSAAFVEPGYVSPSPSFYGGGGYVPSPLTLDRKSSIRSNILQIPVSPISPYAVVRPKTPPPNAMRPKSPAPSIGSQITTSTIPIPSRRQSTPVVEKGDLPAGGRDHARMNLMAKLDENEPVLPDKPVPGSPAPNSHSMDCLESGTKSSPHIGDGDSLGLEGHSNSSPSLRLNRVNPAVFKFPPPSFNGRGRPPTSYSSRRPDYRSKTLSHVTRSTSQMSVQSLSLRSDVSASGGSVISTRSDMWGGRRAGAGHMRFSRQYYSYRRPTASNTRGQRAYKSFRQELLLRSMLLNVVKCRVP